MNKAEKTRILIVDNHIGTRKALVTNLTNFDDLMPVAEASTGIEALHLCSWVRPDVVLMNLKLTESDGVLAAHLIRQLYRDIQVIVLANSHEMGSLIRLELQPDAIGFLKKDASPFELANSIRAGCGARVY